MAKAKKTEVKKPQAKNAELPKAEEIVLTEDTELQSKAYVGNSRIWVNQLLASQNKSFERKFYAEENQTISAGTKLFNDAELREPFVGHELWITVSTTEGENDIKWAACQVSSEGVIMSAIAI